MSDHTQQAPSEQLIREYVADRQQSERIFPACLTEGSLRTSDTLSKAERTRAQDLKREYGLDIGQCYANAVLLACETATDDEPLTYVEGLAVPPQSSIVMEHAWVELHGKVLEVTWPEGVEPYPSAAYFGLEVPVDLVREHRAGEYITPITHPRNPAYKELSKSSKMLNQRDPR